MFGLSLPRLQEFVTGLLHAKSGNADSGAAILSLTFLFTVVLVCWMDFSSSFFLFCFCSSANLVQKPRSCVTVFFSFFSFFFFLWLRAGFGLVLGLDGLGWFGFLLTLFRIFFSPGICWFSFLVKYSDIFFFSMGFTFEVPGEGGGAGGV